MWASLVFVSAFDEPDSKYRTCVEQQHAVGGKDQVPTGSVIAFGNALQGAEPNFGISALFK